MKSSFEQARVLADQLGWSLDVTTEGGSRKFKLADPDGRIVVYRSLGNAAQIVRDCIS